MFDLCDFDLGRVDCSLITVLVFVAIPCSENAPWGFGGAAHVFLVGICACWLAEQLIVSSSLRSGGAGRVSFPHQYGCTVYVYVLWPSALYLHAECLNGSVRCARIIMYDHHHLGLYTSHWDAMEARCSGILGTKKLFVVSDNYFVISVVNKR